MELSGSLGTIRLCAGVDSVTILAAFMLKERITSR